MKKSRCAQPLIMAVLREAKSRVSVLHPADRIRSA